jgi:SAM-dependent methyltransferase
MRSQDIVNLSSLPVKPISTTHSHLLACIRTHLDLAQSSERIPILDVGCGNGELLKYLACILPDLYPNLQFEFYGFDVGDHGVQKAGYWNQTIARLSAAAPREPWQDRLSLIQDFQAWPFPDNFFEIVVSNQVLEHVRSHDYFFAQVWRTLRPNGRSFHLFPLSHCMWEGHLQMPFVHWFQDFRLMRRWIRLCTLLSFGKFKSDQKKGVTRDQFVNKHADFVHYFTNYVSTERLLEIAKRNHLKASFGWSAQFLRQKLLQLQGRTRLTGYNPPRWTASFGFWFCRYLTSITLEMSKSREYRSEIELTAPAGMREIRL